MKKLFILIMVALCSCILLSQANAGPKEKINWGSQTGPASAGPPAGAKLVLNINLQVTNDPDSAIWGFYWALDEYNKHIQVWQLSDCTFYADVKYVGAFTTVGDKSPMGATMTPGIEGNMEGGYQATFSGAIKVQSLYKTKGNIGQFAYVPTTSGPTNTFDWLGTFFDDTAVNSFHYIWWGWQYRTGQNGNWINDATGNLGDIN